MMSTDKQQQEEELLILKSILGDDEIFDLGNDNEQFEVNIEFQLPPTFVLRLRDDSRQSATSIECLPPLVLTMHYHEQYPSSIYSPTFVLSSCYLSRQCLQNMCRDLDKIWEDNLSQPIVYLWIECLKEQFLSSDELCLRDIEMNDDEDPRAMSSYDPNEATQVYQQLMEYNREKLNEKFLCEYHQCSICMANDIPGRDMIRLGKCDHFFCRNCLHDYAQMHINTGSVEWLLCPDVQCQLTLFPSEIKVIVNNDQLYEKYERLLLQKTLEQMQDIVWCPRCQNAVLTGSEEDNLALCDHCHFAFCKKCQNTYHSQTLCADELELREKRRKFRLRMQAFNLGPEEEKKLLQDFLDVAAIENSTRRCPNRKCQVPIEKNMGCDHMFCIRCKARFNWSEARDQTSDTKVLIENYENDFEKIQQALARERSGEEMEEVANPSELSVISKLLRQRTKRCPNPKCEKMNVKSGTGNYLICGHCKRGFCFSCGQSVSNPNRHFGNACKRYSTS